MLLFSSFHSAGIEGKGQLQLGALCCCLQRRMILRAEEKQRRRENRGCLAVDVARINQDKKPGVLKSTATHRRNCYCVIVGGLVRDFAYASFPVALSPGEDTWTMEPWINSTTTWVWTRPPIGHHG